MAADTPSPTTEALASQFPLLSLPPDALRSVLCRVPARDHNSLRLTCRGVRAVVDSDIFRRERCLSGWAETEVSLPTREELIRKARADSKRRREANREYNRKFLKDLREKKGGDGEGGEGGEGESDKGGKNSSESESESDEDDMEEWYGEVGFQDDCYGYQDAEMTLWVDGKSGGTANIVLVPRRGGQMFHDATDAHSNDLQFVGWSYCDARGRLRLRSIKADGGPKCNRGGFLYLRKFKLNPEYRSSGGSTNVAADAIRAIMTHSRLAGKWTLAVYLSDPDAHFLPEDRKFAKNLSAYDNDFLRHERVGAEPTKEERQAHTRRINELAVLDLRPFLRAGFRQVPEMVQHKGNPYHCFAVPSFFASEASSSLQEGASEEMMSHKEAFAIPILQPPELPMSPVGADKKLLDMVKKACSERSCWKEYVRPAEVQEMLDQISAKEQEATALFESTLSEQLERIDDSQREETEHKIRVQMHASLQELEFYQKINEVRTQIQATEDKSRAECKAALDRTNERVRDESSRLVREEGASVEASNILHCAATYLLGDYVLLFMDLVPFPERTKAINTLDKNGMTPLMCTAGSEMVPENDREKHQTMCEQLLSLGADKNVVNPSDGLTALGHYRSQIQSSQDFRRFLNSTETNRQNDDSPDWTERIESLLMPVNGPTSADEALLEGSDNQSGQDDGDMDGNLHSESDEGSVIEDENESVEGGSDVDGDMDESDEDGSDTIEDRDADDTGMGMEE